MHVEAARKHCLSAVCYGIIIITYLSFHCTVLHARLVLISDVDFTLSTKYHHSSTLQTSQALPTPTSRYQPLLGPGLDTLQRR